MHITRVTKGPCSLTVTIVTALALALSACGGSGGGGTKAPPPSAPATLRLSSPAFAAGARIPAGYTCTGKGESPPLAWSGVPAKARELALSVDDPDAPGGGFTHWLLYRIAPSTRALAPGGTPAGALQGRNSLGRDGYSGPCPPNGDKPHRYRFVLYALSRPLGLAAAASPDRFRAAVGGGAAIASGTLTGTYSR